MLMVTPNSPVDVRRNAQSMFEQLDALSRERSLTPSEVRCLERAMDRSNIRMGQKPWLREDVKELHRLLVKGKKPAQIGAIMGRTERAIWTKMWRLKWTVGSAKDRRIVIPATLAA